MMTLVLGTQEDIKRKTTFFCDYHNTDGIWKTQPQSYREGDGGTEIPMI